MSGGGGRVPTAPWVAPTATSIFPPRSQPLRWRLCVVCSALTVVAIGIGAALALQRIMSDPGSGSRGLLEFGWRNRGASSSAPMLPPGRRDSAPSCTGESCHRLARYISESLQDGDPCDNFYEYVCSNWSATYQLQGEAMYSEAVMSTRELEDQLTAMLAAGTEDTSSRAMFDLYNACLNITSSGSETLAFQEVLDSVGLNGFPYAWSLASSAAVAGRLLRVTGVSPFVHISLTDKGIKLYGAPTLFPDFVYVANAHRGWYIDAARRIARMSMPELFDFEQELVALLSAPVEEYSTVTVKELESTAEWNWAEFLTNAMFGIRTITTATKVTYEPKRLGVGLLGLVSSAKPALVLNYLAFRLALAYAPMLPGKRFRKLNDVSVAQTVGWEDGWSERRSHVCTVIAARAEPGLAAYLLVTQSKHEENEPVLRSMAEHAKRDVLEFLGEMSWVTTSFLAKLEHRVKMLKTAFFTPAEWRKFAFRAIQCRPFSCASAGRRAVDVFRKIVAQRQRRRLAASRRPFPDYPLDLFETESRVLDDGTLFVPLGAVRGVYHQEAFWEYHLPRVLLQMSAALLDVFRDVSFQLRSNYTDLHDRFAATESCLHEARLSMSETTSVPFTSNGTAREDVRDLLAVAAAFRAYSRLIGNGGEGTLPGLPFSNDQLFFVHFALSRCERYDTAYEDQLLRHGRRAHAAYRVNGPLRHSVSFSRAFQCRRGSYMNPRRKCVF
ncbi:neprilysin-2-like [Dermacentor andersoni]|uniref:neprilysin-2-like n=1 Tax=Dermacentor andersoni TaxID=34620 RepID=UPI0021554CEA|nr:neprilysin-2-like [Dermacentor andersoni]